MPYKLTPKQERKLREMEAANGEQDKLLAEKLEKMTPDELRQYLEKQAHMSAKMASSTPYLDKRKTGLRPFVPSEAKILIVGTLPGDESIRKQQYYADTGNHFWTIMSHAFKTRVGATYSDRLKFLERNRVALWDVLESAAREGSIDRELQDPEPNNFESLFRQHTTLQYLIFNGKKARSLFGSLVLKKQDLGRIRLLEPLPSTSATPGRYVKSLQEKEASWALLATLR